MYECRKCHTQYNNQEDNFYRESKSKSGFNTLCKVCKKKIDATYRLANKVAISDRRKNKYHIEEKPVSHQTYVDKVMANPLDWRANAIMRGMQVRSQISSIEFDDLFFTKDKIIEIITKQKLCPCCKIEFSCISLLNGKKNPATPSPDRFSNKLGYTQSNTIFICWRCNNLKRDTTIPELEMVIQWLESKIQCSNF